VSVVEQALAVARAHPDRLLAVVGPTASGKTDLAVRVAERIGGEVVSADSVQIYRGFDVGSGKPTPEERARAPHHLIDRLDPLDPMDAARFVALARAGFYKGIIVHRVVPGFVVQLGDPGGDGYGGSGELLRCETSPVPFARLDVGVALAGRDTGSSQIFVALARVPHLDGEYARVGRAEGDWDAVAEGDAITDATVE